MSVPKVILPVEASMYHLVATLKTVPLFIAMPFTPPQKVPDLAATGSDRTARLLFDVPAVISMAKKH